MQVLSQQCTSITLGPNTCSQHQDTVARTKCLHNRDGDAWVEAQASLERPDGRTEVHAEAAVNLQGVRQAALSGDRCQRR